MIEDSNYNKTKEKPFEEIIPVFPKKRSPLIPLLIVFFIFVAVVVFFIINQYRLDNAKKSNAKKYFSQYFEIDAYGDNVDEAIEGAFGQIAQVASRLDSSYADNEINSINQLASVTPVTVNVDTIYLIRKCLQFSPLLEGTFDISVGPIMDEWNFDGRKAADAPTYKEINNALKKVDYHKIVVDPRSNTIYLKDRGMKLYLSTVLPAHALDRARNYLIDAGIKGALLRSANTFTVIGKQADGKEWQAAIPDPDNKRKIVFSVKLQPGESLSFVNSAQKYFTFKGKRYHNIIDPRTGFPARECQLVVVVTDDTTVSAIMANAIFVMGAKKGEEFLDSLKEMKGIIVDNQGDIRKVGKIEYQ